MTSRRDSRVHILERQTDTLLEFENFKRKYLLVNKHITKLNSTLSVRVEELNAQVSSLYVENLRLRASEISLASQLKREKEKTKQVVDEAKNAVCMLMRQLNGIRTTPGVQPPNVSPSSPIVKRKHPSSLVLPPRDAARLVKPPADVITQIRESDEEDADEEEDIPTRLVTTRRPSSSRLPLPKLASSLPVAQPPPVASGIPHLNLTAGATKRKVRRDTALLTVEHVPIPERSSSPIAQPTSAGRSRRNSSEQEDEDHRIEARVDVATIITPVGAPDCVDEAERILPMETIKQEERAKKSGRKGKGRELRCQEREIETLSASERESSESAREKDRRRFGIKDVTNSPRKAAHEISEEMPTEAVPSSTFTTPLFTRPPMFDTLTPRPSPPPLVSGVSTPATDGGSEGAETAGGRERRTRKSVNYAEPKLNTKMRKPDPAPDTVLRGRVSAGTSTRRRKSIPTSSPGFRSDEEGDADVEGPGSGTTWTEGRRKTVHNPAIVTSVRVSRPAQHDTTDAYGMWGSDGRRHSMAV